jgi:hypothetical protein
MIDGRTMLIIFLSSLAGFTWLYLWMLKLKIRLAKIEISETE